MRNRRVEVKEVGLIVSSFFSHMWSLLYNSKPLLQILFKYRFCCTLFSWCSISFFFSFLLHHFLTYWSNTIKWKKIQVQNISVARRITKRISGTDAFWRWGDKKQSILMILGFISFAMCMPLLACWAAYQRFVPVRVS